MKDWLELNRREFLAALGAAYGSAALSWAGPRSWFVEYSGGEDGPPSEQFVNTLCTMCPGGCGLRTRVVHGCAVGVSGNPDHPINRGGLCSRASAVLQDVYNPDRLQHPLKSVGPRGAGQWATIEWDAATDLLAARLGRLRESGRPEALCILLGRDRGLTRTAWQRFAQAFGTPNVIDAFPHDNLGADPAVLATHGMNQRVGYDLPAASYVLSLSSGWLDAHWSTEQAARAFAEFRRGRPGFRPKWVHLESRLSLTAAKADEWIPIRPGTEGALALGIAHVMVREGLYDREFVDRHGFGFEDWLDGDGVTHQGFRRMVLQDYAPGTIQRLTGVPEGTIFRLAREFSGSRPALAIGFDGGGCGYQTARNRMAIHALNALGGAIDVPGGVTVFQELSLLDHDLDVDEVAARGLAMPRLDGDIRRHRLSESAVDLLADSLESGEPYAAEILIFVDADPVFAMAEGRRFGAALSHVPFVTALTAYHNDSSRYADLVVPLMHPFHRWDFNRAHTLSGHPVVSFAQPVMAAPPAMRDPYEVLRTVSERLGGGIPAALPWESSSSAVDEVIGELFRAGKGAAFGSANEQSWAELLESRGWRAPFAADQDSFRRDVLTGGGWADPIYFHREWERVFRAPSAKFAFSSVFLQRSFDALPEPESAVHGDRRWLPDGRSAEGAHDESFPLRLYVYALPSLVSVSSPNLPWLNDIAGAYMFEKWRTWVELHPETAERLDIHNHDTVEVRTPRGRLVLPVRVYAGLMPDVIAIPFGFGRRAGGRWCTGIGENPAELVDVQWDPLTGTALWCSTRASVRKV